MKYITEPTIKATFAFLKLLKVKVNKQSVNDTLQEHPDWPSLLSISDSLHSWKVPNAAGKLDSEQLNDLQVPFIVYTGNYESPVEIVTAVSTESIDILAYPYSRPVTRSAETFLQKWDGVYLIAEANDESGEADYLIKKRNYFFKKLIPFFSFSLILILSFLTLHRNLQITTLPAIRFLYIQFVLVVAGISVTSLLLWYEIDQNNPFLRKVCTSISKGSCNAILTSKAAKVFNWLSWSETGFFYFASSLLILCMPTSNNMNTVQLLGWLNLF